MEKYLKNTECGEYEIYYDAGSICAIPLVRNRNTNDIADCSLHYSGQLAAIENLHGRKNSLDSMDELLSSMKKYIDSNAVDLLARMKDLSVRKITNIDRKKDDRGNFTFLVETKSNKSDIELPETIKFTVPVFKYHPETINLEFSVFFNYEILQEDENAKVRMGITLRNYEIDDLIQQRQREIIEKYLSGFNTEKIYWGEYDINKQTDEWKYKQH